MEITVRSSALRGTLLVTLALVVASGVGIELAKAAYGLPSRHGVVPLLSLSYEQNVPTWYSAALLLACALLLGVLGAHARTAGRPFALHFFGLALAFTYISLDELVELHEAASEWLTLGGIFYFSWVVPAAIVVAILGLAYLRFLGHLSVRTRWRFVLAGTLYVGGALGMELPLGWWTERAGTDNLVYALLDAVEESLEMVGLNVFLLALTDELGARGVRIAFAAPPERTPS